MEQVYSRGYKLNFSLARKKTLSQAIIDYCIINGTLSRHFRELTQLFGKRIEEDVFAFGYC